MLLCFGYFSVMFDLFSFIFYSFFLYLFVLLLFLIYMVIFKVMIFIHNFSYYSIHLPIGLLILVINFTNKFVSVFQKIKSLTQFILALINQISLFGSFNFIILFNIFIFVLIILIILIIFAIIAYLNVVELILIILLLTVVVFILLLTVVVVYLTIIIFLNILSLMLLFLIMVVFVFGVVKAKLFLIIFLIILTIVIIINFFFFFILIVIVMLILIFNSRRILLRTLYVNLQPLHDIQNKIYANYKQQMTNQIQYQYSQIILYIQFKQLLSRFYYNSIYQNNFIHCFLFRMSKLKLKHIQSFLSDMDDFEFGEKQKINLEQHMTPPDVAAQLLYYVYQNQKIQSSIVADIGTGTGMLICGLLYIGAQHAIGFQFDQKYIRKTQQILQQKVQGGSFQLINTDIRYTRCKSQVVDLVVMNPPFGTKQAGIDMVFLQFAMLICKGNIYSMHKSSTRNYIMKFCKQRGYTMKVIMQVKFPLKKRFNKYHKKQIAYTEVDVILVTKDKQDQKEQQNKQQVIANNQKEQSNKQQVQANKHKETQQNKQKEQQNLKNKCEDLQKFKQSN